MKGSDKWFGIDVPSDWTDVVVRAVVVAAVGFVVLQLKELYEAGALDTEASAIDAALIAGGIFALNAFLLWTKH